MPCILLIEFTPTKGPSELICIFWGPLGDFFKDPLPQADLYVIGNVLHGYEPDKCRQLLRLVNASVNAGMSGGGGRGAGTEGGGGPLGSCTHTVFIRSSSHSKTAWCPFSNRSDAIDVGQK